MNRRDVNMVYGRAGLEGSKRFSTEANGGTDTCHT